MSKIKSNEQEYKCATEDAVTLTVRASNMPDDEIIVLNMKEGRSVHPSTCNLILWLGVDDARRLRKQLKKILKEIEHG